MSNRDNARDLLDIYNKFMNKYVPNINSTTESIEDNREPLKYANAIMSNAPKYPLYDMYIGESGTTYVFAFAGYSKKNIKVNVDTSNDYHNELIISAVFNRELLPTLSKEYANNIAKRDINVSYKIAKDVKIASVRYEDGLLIVEAVHIELKKKELEEIQIN